MKRMFWVIGGLALMVGVVVVLVLSSREGQENMATVVEAVNKVDAHPHSKDDWQPAVVSMTIYGDGQVRTGAVSWARLELLEGTVRLSADSIFTVKESATRQGVLVTTLFLQEGRLWAHLTTNQPHEFAVETGNAVAAVRDTRFSVWVLGDVTLVSVAEGEVTLTAQGRRVTIHAGEQATVEGTQPPSLPEAMSDEERVLWAIEGEMPQLAPPTPTPTATETSTPTPTPTATATSTPTSTDTPTATPTCTCTLTPSPTPSPTPTHTSKPTVTPTLTPSPIPTDTPVRLDMKCDVNCYLWGPAGDPAARDPQTNILGYIRGGDAAQVAVKFPSGEVVVLPLSDVLGWPEQSFEGEFEGMPQAGGTYTCTFLDTDGNPIPGAVDSDVYLGGYEPDPPTNLRAEMVEAGVLVTWDPSPVIPGAFDPSGSPPWGQYHVSAAEPAARRLYIWATQGRPLAETSHLIPFRRQDFAPGAVGLPLEEWGDGVYLVAVHAGSWAPEGTNGKHMECTARDPAEDWWIVIEGGEVRVERP